jgi:hypothetical protein
MPRVCFVLNGAGRERFKSADNFCLDLRNLSWQELSARTLNTDEIWDVVNFATASRCRAELILDGVAGRGAARRSGSAVATERSDGVLAVR